MPDVTFSSFWDAPTLEMTQDENLVESLMDHEYSLKAQWQMFEKVMRKYPNVFPEKYVN